MKSFVVYSWQTKATDWWHACLWKLAWRNQL